MTYLEKYLELNPDATEEEVVETKCPSEVFNILGESDNYCVFNDTSNGTDDCKYCWMRTYRNESERGKEMFNKSDLMTGDIIFVRNGWRYVVMKDCGSENVFDLWACLSIEGWLDPNNFREDMTNCNSNSDKFDVMRVMRPNFQCGILDFKERFYSVVYERKPVVKMTMEEMKKKLEEMTGSTIEVI